MLCLAVVLGYSLSASALSVSAKGAVLINGESGEIIWSENESAELPMASTTKIMTALLLCENTELEQRITATKEMVTVEGSSMGLLTGDSVSYRDLLYGMMLASGNDAANTVAISIAGSSEKFAELMNKKAAEIGMKNTHFVTPSGLDSQGHYSTAYDMALLARYALGNKDFAAACGSKYAKLYYGNPPYYRMLKNHNKLLFSYDGAIGVKTGYTKKSGRCLVSAAKRDNKYLIAVTLSAPNDWSDHREMLDYGFSQLETRTLAGESMPLCVASGESITAVSEDVSIALTDSEYNALQKRVYLPQFVYSGVKNGEAVGRVEYTLNGKTVADAQLKAASDTIVEQSPSAAEKIIYNFKMLLKAMV